MWVLGSCFLASDFTWTALSFFFEWTHSANSQVDLEPGLAVDKIAEATHRWFERSHISQILNRGHLSYVYIRSIHTMTWHDMTNDITLHWYIATDCNQQHTSIGIDSIWMHEWSWMHVIYIYIIWDIRCMPCISYNYTVHILSNLMSLHDAAWNDMYISWYLSRFSALLSTSYTSQKGSLHHRETSFYGSSKTWPWHADMSQKVQSSQLPHIEIWRRRFGVIFFSAHSVWHH